MAKLSMFTQNKATVEAKAFLVGEQYAFVKATVGKFNGEIGKNSKGFFKATFASVENATACKKELDAWWDSNKTTIEIPSRKHAPTSKGDAPKTPKISPLEAFVRANSLCTVAQAKEYGFVGGSKDLWNYKVELGLREGKR